MERWTKPVALITTFQPYLLAWVLAIAFFLTLTLVAIISKGRNWQQLVVIFIASYVVLALASIVSAQFVADIQVVALEWVHSQ